MRAVWVAIPRRPRPTRRNGAALLQVGVDSGALLGRPVRDPPVNPHPPVNRPGMRGSRRHGDRGLSDSRPGDSRPGGSGRGRDPGLVRRSSAGPAVAAPRCHAVGRSGQRDHAAADARRPGAAGVYRLAGPVADARVAGGVPGRGRGAGLGAPRLPAAGDPAACDGPGPGGPARRGGALVGGRAEGAARHRLLHRRRGGQLRLRSASRGAGHQRPAGAGPAGERPRAAATQPVGGGAAAGRVAAAGAARGGRTMVGGGHGTRGADLHRRPAAVR